MIVVTQNTSYDINSWKQRNGFGFCNLSPGLVIESVKLTVWQIVFSKVGPNVRCNIFSHLNIPSLTAPVLNDTLSLIEPNSLIGVITKSSFIKDNTQEYRLICRQTNNTVSSHDHRIPTLWTTSVLAVVWKKAACRRANYIGCRKDTRALTLTLVVNGRIAWPMWDLYPGIHLTFWLDERARLKPYLSTDWRTGRDRGSCSHVTCNEGNTLYHFFKSGIG